MGSIHDDHVKFAQREMHANLLRSFFGLVALASTGLVIRDWTLGGPTIPAVLVLLISTGAWFGSTHQGVPTRPLGVILCLSVVSLIGKSALDLGGAAGPALSFAFVPGFFAMLLLGPVWGVLVTLSMLCVEAGLLFTTELSSRIDRVRFEDQVLMTLFASGLGYTLSRTLVSYEKSIATRKQALVRAANRRKALTETIYGKLEPLTKRLTETLELDHDAPARSSLKDTIVALNESLSASQKLAKPSSAGSLLRQNGDVEIRARVMRLWLRIGAVFVSIIVLRNSWHGLSYVPSLFSLVFCIAVDLYLRRRRPARHYEAIAFAVGALATGPLAAHIYQYGPTPDAPPLVIAPSIVLFSALLSQGPATWGISAMQVGILCWVAWGAPLTLVQSRLLGNLALDFVVIAVALHNVFRLRRTYADTLRTQGRALVEAARRQRRLSGTLFHDVRNYLQTVMLLVDCEHDPELDRHARSLARRIERLVALSKNLLLNDSHEPEVQLQPVSLDETLESLEEAYGPRLTEKQIRFVAENAIARKVRAVPELLIESVLGNLLSNSIKFSPPGSIIELTTQPEGEFVRITLSDLGPGIPEEVLEHMDGDGAVPSRPGTAGENGQGYGLQLVKEHLARMNGRIVLQDRLPHGTNAIVWLRAE